ncbi:MAG: chitobiase/beta-hexosaminidase C-terminal domain-containing protein, partial [Firmicutes bacterium]|nr:chitobiase/beta-hexosaminidase C-terminal domain-containing protein [Bacillota bacterium]
MLRKVLRIFICAALMVILCVGTAFAAETFSEAEIAKLRTDGAARVALHKTIEMMPVEELKQYKPEIESAVFYKSKRLSPTAASEENIRITFKTLPGYEKYRDIQLPAGFDGYEMLMATSKNGEYERVGGFSYYPYAKDTNVPACYYAADITKYEDEDYSKMYIKVRYFRRIDDQMVYTKWSDVYKASWPVDGVDGQSAEMVERYNYVGFSLEGGTYYRGVTVKLSAEDGAKIYYTTDGSKPTTKSKRYTKALNISKTTTLKAIAVKNGKKTKIYTQKYTMKVLAPPYKTIQLVAKNGKLKYKITLEPMDSKTTMYYTTDGSKPTKKSKKYTKTFYMDVDKTLRVRSYKTGLTSSTTTIELPEPPGEWRSDGWKGETQTSGDVTITGSNGIAGQFTDVSTETRRFHTPGMDRDQVESAINGYVGYVYSRRFFDDGISMNYADAGKFAKIIETNGKVGVNVFGWRKNYGSDFATNGVLNMVMEAFYFFTEDKDVAYALWSVVDYLNIYGSKYTTNEKIESFGFTITGETDTSMDLTMNGVKIHWEWGDDI